MYDDEVATKLKIYGLKTHLILIYLNFIGFFIGG